MPFTATDWHQRFTQQARWTRELRQHLFNRLQIDRGSRILEVGCGTGAVLLDLDLASGNGSQVFGLDLKEEYLQLARHHLPHVHLVAGDGFDLPFPAQAFDLVYCHFLLLWVRESDRDPARDETGNPHRRLGAGLCRTGLRRADRLSRRAERDWPPADEIIGRTRSRPAGRAKTESNTVEKREYARLKWESWAGSGRNRRHQRISTWNGKCCGKTSEARSASGN